MKNLIILFGVTFSCLTMANDQLLQKTTLLICDQMINSNVNNSARDTLLSAGDVTIDKYEDGTILVNSDYEQFRFAGHGSIMALSTGCSSNATTLKKCVENDKELLMAQEFRGADGELRRGRLNKKNLTLQVVRKKRSSMSFFYKTMTNVILQCRLP